MKSNLQLYHTCKDKATSEACVYSVFHQSYSWAPSFQKYPLNNIHNLCLQKHFCLALTTVIALWKINAKVVLIQSRAVVVVVVMVLVKFGTRLWCRGGDKHGEERTCWGSKSRTKLKKRRAHF